MAVCEQGYYNEEDDGVRCVPCVLGTQCLEEGVTRRSLPLLRGWWRANWSSTKVYQCPDSNRESSGRVGGTGLLCKEHMNGPYCRLCNNSDTQRFYDRGKSECSSCSEKLGKRMTPTWLMVGFVGVCLFFLQRRASSLHRAIRVRFPRLLTRWMPLKGKLRIVWGSLQILYQMPAIYQLSLPRGVSDILEYLTPISDLGFDLLTTVPLECIGGGGFLPQLVVYLLLPLVVLGISYPLVVPRGQRHVHRAENRGSRASRAQELVGRNFRQGLPLALLISFLAFPVVSTKAFQAFPVEHLGDDAYMKADYRVANGSSKQRLIKLWAYLAILLYPLGIPLMYACLLYQVRHTLWNCELSPLASALNFLHTPFRPEFFWWELVLVTQKLFIVGFFVLDPFYPGSFGQLCFILLSDFADADSAVSKQAR